MKKHLLVLIFCGAFSSLCEAQVGAETKTVRIDPGAPPNAPEKTGYKLVFWDEFDAPEIDTSVWCPWGDVPPLTECEPRCFTTNDPANVAVGDGVCRLSITAATNATGPCDDTRTAEMKSFRYPHNGFRTWYLEPGTYLEIRAKMPHGANTGCAGWLYFRWGEGNVYREIDIWETRHDDDTQYQINRHVGAPGAGDPFKVKVRDLQGEKLRLSEHFVTFGMHWEANNIGFFLNGQFVAEYCCFDPGVQFNWPMTLRLSAGTAPLKGVCPVASALPKAMEIDYVRCYVRDTVNPLYIVKMTDSIQVDAQGKSAVCCPSIWVKYLPGVQYEIFSPAAGFEVWPNVPDQQIWGITPHTDLPRDTAYPITVVGHFPAPHTRSDTIKTSFFLTGQADLSVYAPNRVVPQPLTPARVFPTLARGGETLRVENPFFYTLLQIVAADGRVVYEEVVTDAIADVALPAGLSPGVYFVKLHADCALRTCKIFVR